MKKFFYSFRHHKLAAAVFILLVALSVYGVIRWIGAGAEETRYLLATAKTGEIIVSVSGAGQVAASDQVEVTSQAAGKLVYLNAKVGQAVAAGALIAQLDSGDAVYELESARLTYDQLLTVDPDNLRTAKTSVDRARETLADAYVSARAALVAAATNLSDARDGIDALLGGYLSPVTFNLSDAEKNYITKTNKSYYAARDSLKQFLKNYQTLSPQTPAAEIERLLEGAYEAATLISGAAKDAKEAVAYRRDREDAISPAATEAYASATDLTTTANATVSALAAAKNSLVNNQRTLEEAENDLADIQAGPDLLDRRSAALAVRQKEAALADYSVRAPFAGIIAAVPVKRNEDLGDGVTIATLITKQRVAEISLNEIDAATVRAGQKATLTFDALPALTLAGEVVEVGLIGAVNQGVVNYTVKIAFDAGASLVKPGMTVSANLITDRRQNVLTVPQSAIKTRGEGSYLEIVGQEEMSRTVPVTLGLSNNEATEITSGLKEGQRYVVRTIAAAETTGGTQAVQGAPGLFGVGRPRTFTR